MKAQWKTENDYAEYASTIKPALGTLEERLDIIIERHKHVKYVYPSDSSKTRGTL